MIIWLLEFSFRKEAKMKRKIIPKKKKEKHMRG
jgi:hypothetical protein